MVTRKRISVYAIRILPVLFLSLINYFTISKAPDKNRVKLQVLWDVTPYRWVRGSRLLEGQ